MTPFDVFDVVNWALTKYQQPLQRVQQIDIYPSKIAAQFSNAFPAVLRSGTEPDHND